MRKAFFLLAALALVACDGDTSGPGDDDPRLTLSADSVVVAVGGNTAVTATIVNSTSTAQFVSRNEAIATVTPTGGIAGVALGTTYIVASLTDMPDVRDSVRVRVGDGGPLTMTLLGTGQVPERWTSEVAAFGNVAYTGTWSQRFAGSTSTPGNAIKIWNVAGNTPILIDSLIISGVNTISDVQISDDGALLVASLETFFGAADANGLAIYDRSGPGRPTLRSRFYNTNTYAGVHTVKLGRVNGRHYAFLSVNSGMLMIVDITDPVNPVAVHSLDLQPYVHDVFIRDGVLFAAAWGNGLRIFDVGGAGRGGSPTNPVHVGTVVTSLCSTCSFGANVHNVWWFHDEAGNKRYAFVGEEGPGSVGAQVSRGALHVVDVSNLAQPHEVAIYEPLQSTTANGEVAGAHNFVMDEASGILYAAFYNGGVRALDVLGDLSNCTTAQRTNGFCDLRKMGREVAVAVSSGPPKYIWGVARVGTSLYASDMHVGIHKIDISGMQR